MTQRSPRVFKIQILKVFMKYFSIGYVFYPKAHDLTSCMSLKCYKLWSCDNPLVSLSRRGLNVDWSSSGEGAISFCSHIHKVICLNQGPGPNDAIALCSLGRKVNLTYYYLGHDSAIRENLQYFKDVFDTVRSFSSMASALSWRFRRELQFELRSSDFFISLGHKVRR